MYSQTMQPPKKKTLKTHTSLKTNSLKWLDKIQFHGANRLAKGDASWYWIPSMIILLISCIFLVHFNITRYQQNPTVLIQQDFGNYELAFPSVIICPEVNFHNYKISQFLTKIKYPAGLNESYVREVLPQLAVFFSPDVVYHYPDLINLEYLLKYNGMDIETAGKHLITNCEDILIRCRWQHTYQNCSKLFRMELTRDGFCCVFNGRSLRREMRLGKSIKKTTPQLYTRQFGFTSGLMMAVNQSQQPKNIDLSYKWIAVQGGQRFVDASFNGTPLNPGSEQWIYYYVYGFHIADSARELSADLRRCNFAEDSLKYFPIYRRKYCALEYEMDETIKKCNCVRVVHPRPQGVPYCDAKGLRCAERVSTSSCGCVQTCNIDTALIRTASFDLNYGSHSIDHFYHNLDYKKVTVVRTFIQKRRTTVKQRWPVFTYVYLFSQLGGTFNVFFGCSVLTILGLAQAIWSISLSVRPRQRINTNSCKKIVK